MKWILREGIDFQPEGPNSRGSTFTQLFQVIPAIEPFYMEWEKKYDSSPVYEWMKSVPWVPIAGVILYVVGIFGGQALMKNRKPFDLKWPLAYWNLALSLFSIMGMVRVVPHLIYLTATKGLGVVACGAPEPLYGNAAVGFWVQAFILSKLAELIDTAFIVLRKKPLQFLHWYVGMESLRSIGGVENAEDVPAKSVAGRLATNTRSFHVQVPPCHCAPLHLVLLHTREPGHHFCGHELFGARHHVWLLLSGTSYYHVLMYRPTGLMTFRT